MKKLLLLSLLSLLFVACGDKDKEDEKQENLIVGNWKFAKIQYYQDGTYLGEEIEHYYHDCPDYLALASDKNYQWVYFEEDCSMYIEGLGRYTYVDGMLSLVEDGDVYAFPVSSLSDTEMIVEQSFSQNGSVYKEVLVWERLN